jgi:excisionase family DNA binding protein
MWTAENLYRAIHSHIEEMIAEAEHRILAQIQHAAQPDRTLDFKEAVEYLHIPESTLRRMLREKRIPHRTHGSDRSKNPRYLFSTHRLDAWVREQEDLNYRHAK